MGGHGPGMGAAVLLLVGLRHCGAESEDVNDIMNSHRFSVLVSGRCPRRVMPRLS